MNGEITITIGYVTTSNLGQHCENHSSNAHRIIEWNQTRLKQRNGKNELKKYRDVENYDRETRLFESISSSKVACGFALSPEVMNRIQSHDITRFLLMITSYAWYQVKLPSCCLFYFFLEVMLLPYCSGTY